MYWPVILYIQVRAILVTVVASQAYATQQHSPSANIVSQKTIFILTRQKVHLRTGLWKDVSIVSVANFKTGFIKYYATKSKVHDWDMWMLMIRPHVLTLFVKCHLVFPILALDLKASQLHAYVAMKLMVSAYLWDWQLRRIGVSLIDAFLTWIFCERYFIAVSVCWTGMSVWS